MKTDLRRPDNNNLPDGLRDSRQAAGFLGISERLLWDLRQQGIVPHVRLGRAVRYDPADLQAVVEQLKRRG